MDFKPQNPKVVQSPISANARLQSNWVRKKFNRKYKRHRLPVPALLLRRRSLPPKCFSSSSCSTRAYTFCMSLSQNRHNKLWLALAVATETNSYNLKKKWSSLQFVRMPTRSKVPNTRRTILAEKKVENTHPKDSTLVQMAISANAHPRLSYSKYKHIPTGHSIFSGP